MSLAGPTGQPRLLRGRGQRRLKSAGHSVVKTPTSGTAGVKVAQPLFAVAHVAGDLQSGPSRISGASQPEELLERPQASESN